MNYILILAVITFTLVILACKPQIVFADLYEPPIPKPPLAMKTSNGGYTVTIDWQPRGPIEPYPHYNVTTTFFISIADRNGVIPTNKDYLVTVKDSDSTIIKEFNSAVTDEKGYSAPLDVQFREQGFGHVIVCIPADSSINPNSCADFAIVVVPEFPAAQAILVMAATISMSVFLMRKIHFKA